jgi:hypothetical protein
MEGSVGHGSQELFKAAGGVFIPDDLLGVLAVS